MFATYIPELANLLKTGETRTGRYLKHIGERHVITCGTLNYRTVKNFLRDFLDTNRERASRDFMVIFLGLYVLTSTACLISLTYYTN